MYEQSLIKYLMSRGCNRTDAEDITQDTQVLVLRNKAQDYPYTYYKTTAHNRLVSIIRKKKPNLFAEVPDVIKVEGELDERIQIVLECLEQLHPIDKEALKARYWEDLSIREASRKFGLTESGWKNRLQDAKVRLKALVKEKMANFS
jgi:RNA polymerase sigma factor (sigma-70 family)